MYFTKNVICTNKRAMNIINDFTDNGKNKEVIDKFLYGFCYDFALMLWLNTANSKIIYIHQYFTRRRGHYVVLFEGEYYDVTGKLNIDINKYRYEIDNTKNDLLKRLSKK